MITISDPLMTLTLDIRTVSCHQANALSCNCPLYIVLCIVYVCQEAKRAGKAEEKIVVNFNVYQIPSEPEISAGGNPGVSQPAVALGGRNAGLELKIKQSSSLLSSPLLCTIKTKLTQ